MKTIGSERDLMRQGQQNRRGRGRGNHTHNQNHNQNQVHNQHNNQNRKPQNQLSKNYESSGPDVKIRGTAHHIAEKYMHLARDASSAGDFIIAENYLQHAEHYNRIIMAAQAASPQQHTSPQPSQPAYQNSDQPPLNGHAHEPAPRRHHQPEDRRNQRPVQEDTAGDALPGFLTQPFQAPDSMAEARPEDAEKEDAAPRPRRRRRPANGPEGRVEKANGHSDKNGFADPGNDGGER
jgi:hypothetical protein